MLLPVLSGAKNRAQGAQCGSNLRQIGLAELMYRGNNHGYFVPNHGDVRRPIATSGRYQTWANGRLNFRADWDDNFKTALFMDPKHADAPGRSGLLGPYIKNPAVFKCPSDKSQALINGSLHERVRSMSMNFMVGGHAFQTDRWSYLFVPRGFERVAKESEVTGRRHPERLFTFVDEREDSISEGVFIPPVLDGRRPVGNYISIPSNYHGDGGNLLFADGHLEHRKWKDRWANPPLVKGIILDRQSHDGWLAVGNPDGIWLSKRGLGWAD